jgi:type VI protein secretion system component VasK
MNYHYSPIYIFCVIVVLILFWAIYFTPAIIARGRKNSGTILLCNLLFGATGVGWLICLIWALKSERRKKYKTSNPHSLTRI